MVENNKMVSQNFLFYFHLFTDEAKTTKTSKIPEFKVSSKSTSTTVTITYQSMKPGKHTVVLSHDDVTVKTSKAGEMTSQTQDHVFHGLQPATEYSLQLFTFKASGGKECVHTESVYTGKAIIYYCIIIKPKS